jgi:hypothetical protein
MINVFEALLEIMCTKQDFTDETKTLFEENLSDVIRCQDG